ncbi:MAG TPA: hypothetical protein EYN79_01260 [Planctomycetes bacterium]|nr:hypothetical protein [Planctomycetota bacterium]HIN79872.1 hypothetical protein [Planctomycetota bacterium]HIO65431.1 hypothetical protein [Planctomycetota bacterium]
MEMMNSTVTRQEAEYPQMNAGTPRVGPAGLLLLLIFAMLCVPSSGVDAQTTVTFGCHDSGCNPGEVRLGWIVVGGPVISDPVVEIFEWVGSNYLLLSIQIGSPMDVCYPSTAGQFRIDVYDNTGTNLLATDVCILSSSSSSVVECSVSGAPIPDLGSGLLSETIISTVTQQISDLDMMVRVTHPAVGDLRVTVTSPFGTTVTTHQNNGGSSSNIHVTYDDSGIANASPYSASGNAMKPSGPGTMADFIGECRLGAWTLEITDTVAGNTGVLNSWCLSSTGGATCNNAYFVRSDSNVDGNIDSADAIFTLYYVMGISPSLYFPQCEDAADINDDGKLDIADPIFTLHYLFGNGQSPQGPGTCGPDPTPDGLGCDNYPPC